MRRNEVNVITLGCSKNLVDSEQLMRRFVAAGYSVRHDPKRITGEIVVINTCGFIGAAQEESINTILSFVQAKKEGRIARLIVMGCLSERFREELKQEIPEIDAIYGKFDWKDLVSDLGPSFSSTPASEEGRLLTTPKHYAYIKISEGCDRGCSYCAIPLITGKQKSRTQEDIVHEVQTLVGAGCSEFQLIAQDLTSYGRDLYGKVALAPLLEKLSDLSGVRRLRLHYAYPTQFPHDILPLMRERDNICNYLDIALQHASDNMLRTMRRNITQEETERLLDTIRDQVPHIALRTTMMVGHPGESEADFQELLDFVSRMRFERLGAFAYSHEQSTYAYKHYQDDIPEAVKLERLDTLMALQQPIAEAFSESLVGTTQEVVIDRRDEEFLIGRTPYDSPEIDPEVLIPLEQVRHMRVGSYYNLPIVASDGFDLIAKPLSI